MKRLSGPQQEALNNYFARDGRDVHSKSVLVDESS